MLDHASQCRTTIESALGKAYVYCSTLTTERGILEQMNIALPSQLAYRIGLLTKKAMKLRGGGSALPGLITEKLDPQFLTRTLGELPQGVVVISGTNGKTTTTKMVAQLLRAEGLKVFTNPTGSNFTRGIVAALLDAISPATGKLEVDIAVLELDEAHAVHFIRHVKPRYSLMLNVLRDQLDRFGEIDYTARLLGKVVEATSEGVVLNREDPLVSALHAQAGKGVKVQYFGLSPELKVHFPSDDELRASNPSARLSPKKDESKKPQEDDTILASMSGNKAAFSFGTDLQPEVSLKLDGIYNVLNAAAALGLVRLIRGKSTNGRKLLDEISEIRPAFGRGEAVEIDGHPLEIILVKNPSGFRLALRSYAKRPASTMIAINDNYADGRDMSWLWDVDFDELKQEAANDVAVVSGIRAYDMALRLQYDNVTVAHVEPNLDRALRYFLEDYPGPKRIYCTYTAMLRLRRLLAKNHKLESIE